MSGFSIEADRTERDVDREVSENFIEDLVEYSRMKQVLNEEQAIVTWLIYGTGLLPKWEYYVGGRVTGGSGGGKSHMKQQVIDDSFAYVPDWLYSPTGFSPKAIQDDDEWDSSKIAALNELQKVPQEVLEFLKSAHGDDGGFDYRRNVSDPDSESGFSAKKLQSEPKPVVFMLADENEYSVEQELQTRLIEIKVDESEAKNRAVHRMKWGHDHLELDDREGEYIWEDPDLEHIVRDHIRGMDDALEDIDDVVLPTNDGRHDGDDWDAAHVTEPLFKFKKSQSARASSMLASLVRASAAYNYHNRETVSHGDETYLVAAPTDVANVLICRSTLLALTHGLTEKKFAVLDAIIEKGGPAPESETALQATKDDVIDYIQNTPDIASMSKSEIKQILDELDEDLILNKKDHPEDARKNMYVYDGGATFRKPNVYDYWDHFEGIEDPIRRQPLEVTLDEQLESLNATMDMERLTADSLSDGADGSLSDFSDSEGGDISELDEVAQNVAQRLSETLDGKWVPARVMESNSLKIEHMVGEAPIEEYEGENADGELVPMVEPERSPEGGDYVDGFLSNTNELWDDMGLDEVEGAVETAIGQLRDEGIFELQTDDVGNAEVAVNL